MDHTATRLPDGRVLVVGGWTRTSGGEVIHSSAELWDPATGSFAPAGSLAEARARHTATLLADGRVLVVGGAGTTDGGVAIRSAAEIWDPDSVSFAWAGSLHEGRFDHTATLLADDSVLVVGGYGTDGALGTAESWAP
jgi:hypothetical protein